MTMILWLALGVGNHGTYNGKYVKGRSAVRTEDGLGVLRQCFISGVVR